MKVSNFRDLKIGKDKMKIATVDVETGIFCWKKTETRQVARGNYAVFWFFVDNGMHTPGLQVERLYKSFEAKAA